MNRKVIEDCVRASVEQHLDELRATPGDLHRLFMAAAEKPLLDVVMQRAEGNQSRAAEWLGINRNTLHKKLVEHRLVK